MTPLEPVGPDWRATRPAGAGSGRRALPIILALAALAAVALGVLLWAQPPREPILLAVNSSPAPFAVADFRLISSLPGRSPPVPLSAEPDRDQLRTAVAALRRTPSRTPVVLYLGGTAEVDAEGQLVLAPTVAGADHARNRWPFVELLQSLADSRATRKLLVLNLTAAAGDWVTAATRALDAVPDAGRKVLLAHGVGETRFAGLEWGGSVFAGYFAEGYRGAADGWNTDGRRDGRVTADELAAFVRARVARWASRNRTAPQTPWLTGEGDDFELASVSVADEEVAPAAPINYPQPLRDAWAERDAWLADGRSVTSPGQFLALERALLTMDRQWFRGTPADAARAAFDLARARPESDAERVPDVLKPVPTADPAQVQAVARYVARAESPPDPAEKPPAVTPSAVLAVAGSDVDWTPARWKRLAALLAGVEPDPSSLLSLLVRRLRTTADPVSPALAGRLVRATAALETAARDVPFFPWGKPALTAAESEFRTAAGFTLSPGHVSAADAGRALTTFETTVQSLSFARGRYHEAAAELRRAERLPPQPSLTTVRQRLREALAPADRPLAETANGWASLTADTAAARAVAEGPARAAAVARLRRQAAAGTDGPATLVAFDELLAFPLLSAPERTAVWADRLALAAKLHDDVRARDRREDADIATGSAVAPWRDPRERPAPAVDRPPPAGSPFTGDRPQPPRDFLNWHAARFIDWVANPLDLPDFGTDAEFAAKAADACRSFGAAPPPRPRVEWAAPADGVALTPSRRDANADVRLRLLGSDQPLRVRPAVHSPADEWVTGRAATDIELSPIRATPVPVTVAAGLAPEKSSRFGGVLLSATVAGRPSFKRLRVDTDRLSNRLELRVRAGADGPELPASALPLRPNGVGTPFTFLLSNPTAAPQTVAVRLADPPRQIATLTVPPGKSVPLVFPPPPPTNPPGTAPPATTLTAPDEFHFQLLDPKTGGELQAFSVPVKLLEPGESLTVREAVFRPGGDGKPGELAAVVAERETFRGPPMAVAVAFPTDRNPGLVVPDGKLSGTLEPGGAPLRLYATDPRFDRGKGGTVTLTVAADGVERAFVFRGDIGNDGGVVRLQPVTTPRVTIAAADFATGTDPLPVRFEVENTPPGATLDVDIGTPSGAEFRRDYRLEATPPPPARRRTVTLAVDPKGAFTLAATVTDTAVSLPVDRLVGERFLRARVLDANGREIARAVRRVVFDGSAPRNVRFLDPPARAKAAAPLAVRVAVDRPVSGVKEVSVFLGKPVNNAPPPMAVRIPAKPDGDAWTATVPLGSGPVPADITAEVVSGSGLAGFATMTVELVPAAEFDKPKPGAVAGKVVEGSVDQPGLTVQLFDDKGKEKAKVKTKDDGTFAFADLPPGKYRVFAAKATTGREKGAEVEVKAGQTTPVTLSLVLK